MQSCQNGTAISIFSFAAIRQPDFCDVAVFVSTGSEASLIVGFAAILGSFINSYTGNKLVRQIRA